MHGSIAAELGDFPLFVASVASFLNLPYLERHANGGVLTATAGSRATIIATSAGIAAAGAALGPLLILVAVDALDAGHRTPKGPSCQFICQMVLVLGTPRMSGAGLQLCAASSVVHTAERSLGRVRLTQGSSDRAPVAHHRVRHDALGVAEDRERRG